jgi:hypothetical protein
MFQMHPGRSVVDGSRLRRRSGVPVFSQALTVSVALLVSFGSFVVVLPAAGGVDASSGLGSPSGSFIDVGRDRWVAVGFAVAGTQMTGLELAVATDAGWGTSPGRTGEDLVISVRTASPDGLPEGEIASHTATVTNHGDCANHQLTQVTFSHPLDVIPGQVLFVALGTRDEGRLRWCEYDGSSPRTVATSGDGGSTWSLVPGPPEATSSEARSPGAPGHSDEHRSFDEPGFAALVVTGPPAVLPEAPVGLLLPVAGAAIIGGAVLVVRRRARRATTTR